MTVYLVGAGPGDPGLMTVRGAEVLARADVVVYDRLSVSALLDLAPADAERISVAKSAGRAVMPQDDINALLVERGLAGQEVVRLKGGDPFVFARGGEEAAALQAAGVAYEVVPGITSAIAAPAYAGIPVTLRHSSTSFTVITGHEDPDKGGELDWEAVARLGGTIVVLMGVGRLPQDRRRGSWPAASRRTRRRRRCAGAPVPSSTRCGPRSAPSPTTHLEAPSVIVIGAVAATDLDWFESRPLFGKKVVVTRPARQSSELAAPLRAAGAEPVVVPTIEIVDPDDDGAALRAALHELADVAWLVRHVGQRCRSGSAPRCATAATSPG